MAKFTPSASGTLYLVGLPIGDDDDITLRALKTLNTVDIIAAEDTRRAGLTLRRLGVTAKRLLSHHEHNENHSAPGLIDLLKTGHNMALVTDAGMPTVSDPGFVLVRAAVEAGIKVVPVPGVSASTTALAVSGIASDSFTFLGFPPRKEGALRRWLTDHAGRTETLIVYESPQRVVKTLAAMADLWGAREACLCRELTKTYEEIVHNTLQGLHATLAGREQVLGEVTLVIAGCPADSAKADDDTIDAAILAALESGLSAKVASGELALRFNLPKRDIYQRMLQLKK